MRSNDPEEDGGVSGVAIRSLLGHCFVSLDCELNANGVGQHSLQAENSSHSAYVMLCLNAMPTGSEA